jgi:hypothetical protein
MPSPSRGIAEFDPASVQALLGVAGQGASMMVPFGQRNKALMDVAMQNPDIMSALAGAPGAIAMIADKIFGQEPPAAGITPSPSGGMSPEDEARLDALANTPLAPKKKPKDTSVPERNFMDIFMGRSPVQQPGY